MVNSVKSLCHAASLIVNSLEGENQGVKIAAATYLKNLTRRNIDEDGGPHWKVGKEFKDQLLYTLLQVEPAVLKVLIEAVCSFLMAIACFLRIKNLLCKNYLCFCKCCNLFAVPYYCISQGC